MNKEKNASGAPRPVWGLLYGLWTGLRAVLRLGAFTLANLAIAVFYFLALPFSARSPTRRKRLRDGVFRTWARASIACTGVKVTVRGVPPKGPCFLVSNHVAYTDIWVLASLTAGVFVAESGIASWPFFGFMARTLSIIFIDRGNKRAIPDVNRRIEEALEQGHVLVVFPEGTTGGGARVLPFRSALLEPAARGGHPVAWATMEYRTGPRDPPASEVVCWKDGVRLYAHAMRLLRLDLVEATVTFWGEALRASDRKDLAAELQRRVEAQFRPIP